MCKYPRCLCGFFASEAGCKLRLSWLSSMIHCSFQSHWLPGFSSPSCKCDLSSLFLDVWPCIWLYWDAWLEESQLISIGLLCVVFLIAGWECTYLKLPIIFCKIDGSFSFSVAYSSLVLPLCNFPFSLVCLSQAELSLKSCLKRNLIEVLEKMKWY